jgi:DNA-binding beta-propeller fold protein YncE
LVFFGFFSGDALYVTDFNLHVVFELDVHLRHFFPLIPPGNLFRPSGLALDPAGNLIVADTRHNALKVFSPSGKLINQISSLGSSSPLDLPSDLTLMKAGFIAALDSNGRVTIF